MKLRFLFALCATFSLSATVTHHIVSSIDEVALSHSSDNTHWVFLDLDETIMQYRNKNPELFEGQTTKDFFDRCVNTVPTFALTARLGHTMGHRSQSIFGLRACGLNFPQQKEVDEVFKNIEDYFLKMEDVEAPRKYAKDCEKGRQDPEYQEWLKLFKHQIYKFHDKLIHECHYANSIIYTGGGDKGKPLARFLEILQEKGQEAPRRITFVDDRGSQIESVMEEFRDRDDIHVDVYHLDPLSAPKEAASNVFTEDTNSGEVSLEWDDLMSKDGTDFLFLLCDEDPDSL